MLNYLIRGLPGSGKSTYARTHLPDHLLVEADQYFMVGDRYCFDPTRLKDAHAWCLWRFKQAVAHKIPVVVANTFVRIEHMKPYLEVDPNIRVITCNGQFGNVHGVPDKTIERMRAAWEHWG